MATGPVTTDKGEFNFWITQSVIGTTAWPVATRAMVFHPGINLELKSVSVSPSSGSGSGSGGSSSGSGSGSGGGGGGGSGGGGSGPSSSGSGSGVSIGGLGSGASIGIIVAIVLGALLVLGVAVGLYLRKRILGRRQSVSPAPVADLYMTPEQKRQSQPTSGPYSPLGAK